MLKNWKHFESLFLILQNSTPKEKIIHSPFLHFKEDTSPLPQCLKELLVPGCCLSEPDGTGFKTASR